MNISTQRCLVRRFSIDEIDSFTEYRNNPDWMRYQGFKGLTKLVYEKELLENVSLARGAQYAIINTTTKQLIGDIYLRQENDVLWFGYTIHPRYSRQGYAYEAGIAIINWAKETEAGVIKAGVMPENIASINLLKKLGFIFSTTIDDELVYTFDLKKL